MNEELKEFIEENEFVRVSHDLDLFECAGGHIWHLDQIADFMLEVQNEKAINNCADW